MHLILNNCTVLHLHVSQIAHALPENKWSSVLFKEVLCNLLDTLIQPPALYSHLLNLMHTFGVRPLNYANVVLRDLTIFLVFNQATHYLTS